MSHIADDLLGWADRTPDAPFLIEEDGTVHTYDEVLSRARQFAQELSRQLRIEVRAVSDLAGAVRESDICVTCTPSTRPLFGPENVSPGTFIAAVGADNEQKQELDPRLMASSKIVVDSLEQCATIGDLHHALEQGLVTREDVHAELGEVIAGQKEGRTSDDEVIVFDSTGLALQDVAAAAIVYERATKAGKGLTLDMGQKHIQ